MITQSLDWSVGYTTDPCIAPKEFYNAAVPGSVQSDYAKAMHLPPYQYETNFSDISPIPFTFIRGVKLQVKSLETSPFYWGLPLHP